MYDLPSEEVGEPGLPDQQSDWTWRMRFAVPRSQYHPIQAELIEQTFQPLTYSPEQVFSAMDLNIYSLNWIPTSTEREEQERQRAERFRRLLIENGINPDEA